MPLIAYTPLVADHFDRPRNVGRLVTAPGVIEASAGRISDGVRFHLSARVSEDVITEVQVEVYGCPHCIAAASWTSEQLVGGSRPDLERWTWRAVADALEIPHEKRGRLLILEDSIRRLAAAWPHQS
jgi:NifU-like protein involved in Fe-S cluster formation